MFRRAALGILLAVAMAELLARVWRFVPMHYDPAVGYIHAPGREFVLRTEGNGSGRWGPAGIRRLGIVPDPEAPFLLALGDSFVEGLQVSDEEVFSTRLERRLLADGHRFRVAAVAQGGWTAAEYDARAPDFQRAFRPSWAVVVLAQVNLEGAAWDPDGGNCYFFLGPDGKPAARRVIRLPAHGDTVRWLRNLSALGWFSEWRLEAFRAGVSGEAPLFHAGRFKAASRGTAATSYPVEEELDLILKAWGSRVTFLIHGPFDWRRPLAYPPLESRVAQWASARGASLVNVREEYPALARRGLSPYGFSNTGYNRGHWNAEGHAAVARTLEREILSLRQRGLL